MRTARPLQSGSNSSPVLRDRLDVQANPFTVASGQQSEINAIVRDPNGNLVKNKVVIFELTDNTNGFLSVGSEHDRQSGQGPDLLHGRQRAECGQRRGNSGVSCRIRRWSKAYVFLTVAQRAVDIFIGTSDVLFLPDPARYAQEWVLLATDTVGNPVENTVIQASLRSVRYYKGQMILTTVGSDIDWVQVVSTAPGELLRR